ncbi:MAG: SLC13 family permease [Planctomycetota bacterium]|nr:SLC13 family permease [Planctomycetota bacterium]
MDLPVEGWIALGTLAAATTLFITKKLPIPVTALAIPVVLYATQVLPDARDVLQGFGSQAALAIAAVFVLGAGLKESGVATLMARGLQRVGGKSEPVLVALLMVSCGLLSAVMSNAAVVAILLPVGVSLAHRAGVATSRLLMPLAFAAVLGGTVTLIGTAPNFLVGDYVLTDGAQYVDGLEFHIFDFAPVGLAILAVGTLFMVFVGRRMLPVNRLEDRMAAGRLPAEVAQSFDVAERLFALSVPADCALRDKTIAGIDIRNRFGLSILMIYRPKAVAKRWLDPEPDRALREGDILYVQGEEVQAWSICEDEGLQFGLADERAMARVLRHGATLAEFAIPPYSRAVGRTARDMKFRERFGLNMMAINRREAVIDERPQDEELEVGDAFAVTGPVEKIHRLGDHPDFTLLTDMTHAEDATQAPLAILLLVAALIPPILLDVPLAVSALGAALLMFVCGCVSRRAVRRAVDWNVIFLIVGTLPLGMALDRHEVAGEAAGLIVAAGDSLGTVGVLSLLFLLAAVLAVLTSNAAAAVIAAPVAARAAMEAGIDVRDALLVMGYGCSCAFLLPFAQCNILVMAPGGYGTKDFVRVGAVMSVVMAITTIAAFALF